mgnify:CR=1 FL=1
MNIMTIHGYASNPSVWEPLVQFLSPPHRVRHFDYSGGWNWPVIGITGARLYNRKRGGLAARQSKKYSSRICIAHSNGNVVANYARHSPICKFKHLIAIHPALDADFKFHPAWKTVHVLYDQGDLPVRWARRLIGHDWGDMGARGYQGHNPKVVNVEYDNDEGSSIADHSECLHKPLVDKVGPLIMSIIDGIR